MRTIKMISMALLTVLMLTSCFSDESITETTINATVEETTAEETTAEETTAEETTAEETTAEETTAEETTAEETTAEETTAEETTAEETTAEETTAEETTAEETYEGPDDFGFIDYNENRIEIVTNASDFTDLASKFSDSSKSFLIEQAMKRSDISDGEDSLTSVIAKIFNNPLLYFDDYAPCAISHTFEEHFDGGICDYFAIAWHPKECKEKFHTTCRVLEMTLVSYTSKLEGKGITKGMEKKEFNGIQYYHKKVQGSTIDLYVYIVNENTFLRFNSDPNYVNEEDVYKLLCYGKELSEILEPIFVEE